MLSSIRVISMIIAIIMPWILFAFERPLIALGFLILIPVSILVRKLSTHENRSSQLLSQFANAVEWETKSNRPLDSLKKNVTAIETRFLSNDDELFVKKAMWERYLDWTRRKFDFNRDIGERPVEDLSVLANRINIGPVWNTDIPHRQGYKDSNTIEDEWAIIKALRHNPTSYRESYGILNAASTLAKKNPVVFERFLRKKKISYKLKDFKRMARIHYLSAVAKIRLVTFVEEVLSLEPTALNEVTVTLLHEKNEQIKKYTDEFWNVHRRSLKFYWAEALWLLLLIPFIAGAGFLVGEGAQVEAVILFTFGAALVAFGEMALVVKQKIKLNGKKLMPPLIASLIGSRHAMCADINCEIGIDNYRRKFKNLEKHFIMTTPEIDSVKYVMNNLRDEERAPKLLAAKDICQDAQRRMDSYYKMFHLYRQKCLQFGCIELFLAIMYAAVWGFWGTGLFLVGFLGLIAIIVLGINVVKRHIQVWRFKEMYFKIYQGLSVLIVDDDLRLDPEKLKNMFREIEQSALNAICTDPTMFLMADTLSRVSGLEIPKKVKPHELDREIERIRYGGWR